MNNEELIKAIADEKHYTQIIVRDILEGLSTVVKNNLEDGRDVNIAGLGTFKVKTQKEKIGIINVGVNKGKKWIKPKCKIPTFRISKKLNDIFK